MERFEILQLQQNPTKEAIIQASVEIDKDLRELNRQMEDLQNLIGKQLDYQEIIIDLKLSLNN